MPELDLEDFIDGATWTTASPWGFLEIKTDEDKPLAIISIAPKTNITRRTIAYISYAYSEEKISYDLSTLVFYFSEEDC